MTPVKPMPLVKQSIIARFSEITLKGGNRGFFEKQIAKNAALHLKDHGKFSVIKRHARLEIIGEENLEKAVDIIRGLPGVANVSRVRHVPCEMEPLKNHVVSLAEEIMARGDLPANPTFRMDVSRKEKRHALTSPQIAAELGSAVLEKFPQLRVDLSKADFSVMVEVWESEALLFEEKIQGPGGLAVGSSGTAICLLSGGIDSPVAAHMMMTRGCPVVFLNFHSFPFIGEQSREKVEELVRFLARYQPHSRLYIAPFAEIQTAIRDNCPEGLRTILYRRLMNRVANHVAEMEGALALVTGEAVGQVASQTMENILAIAETAAFPVMQPLIGLGKGEIIHRARAIGTYPISIQPFPDCCTLFQPRWPETRAKLEKIHQAEESLDINNLVAQCVAGLEKTDYGPEYFPARWEA